MCFGSSITHVRMNLMYPDNHNKGVVELTVKQKKEIDSELTTPKVENQNGSKSKVEQKFCSISPKTNRKKLLQRESFPKLLSTQQIDFPQTLKFN